MGWVVAHLKRGEREGRERWGRAGREKKKVGVRGK